MNQLIPENSPLRLIPTRIYPEQRLYIEAFRISIDIYEYKMQKLKSLLTNVVETEPPTFLLFSLSWEAIDYANRAFNVVKKIPGMDTELFKTDTIEKARKFRNTFQHLDERIKESLSLNNFPTYGQLMWSLFDNPKEGIIKSYTAFLGMISTNITDILNPVGKILINNPIELLLVSKGRREDETLKIDLLELEKEIIELTTQVQENIEYPEEAGKDILPTDVIISTGFKMIKK